MVNEHEPLKPFIRHGKTLRCYPLSQNNMIFWSISTVHISSQRRRLSDLFLCVKKQISSVENFMTYWLDSHKMKTTGEGPQASGHRNVLVGWWPSQCIFWSFITYAHPCTWRRGQVCFQVCRLGCLSVVQPNWSWLTYEHLDMLCPRSLLGSPGQMLYSMNFGRFMDLWCRPSTRVRLIKKAWTCRN